MKFYKLKIIKNAIYYFIKRKFIYDYSFLMGLLIGLCIMLVYNARWEIGTMFPSDFYNLRESDIFKPYQLIETKKDTLIADQLYNDVKVLCWVTTRPNNRYRKVRHVKNTWGKRCNKFVIMSTEIDNELDTVALPVGSSYKQLWNKTKEAFNYIYKNYLNDYDWFLKADDDTYIIVENLRYMLYSYDPNYPIYFGCNLLVGTKHEYTSGGAGYVLSREAVKRYFELGKNFKTICNSISEGPEDFKMGQCLKSVGVVLGNSKDAYNHSRFFPINAQHHVAPFPWVAKWYWRFTKVDKNIDCCSEYAISFHYVKPREMYLYHYMIYHLKPFGILAKEKLPEKIII